jgi:hypothetical protein
VPDSDLDRVLDIEYKDWMAQITAIFRERDNRIDEFKREAFNRASPEGALVLWSRPVKLQAIRKAVEARLKLREEYGRNEPELLSDDCLFKLNSDLERFISNAIKDDQRSLPEGGDILAYARAEIDKLSLKRKWWQMANDARNIHVTLNNSAGAVVNVESVVGKIHTNARSIASAGNAQLADVITKLADVIKQSSDLGNERGEMLQNIEALSNEAAKPPHERIIGVVKSLYLGLASGLKTANDAATAWNHYGPIIAGHLGLQ